MSRRRRIALAAGVLVAVAVAAVAVPEALRRMEFFQVRGVEVYGLRYLDARQVAAALALPKQASLFDDPAPLTRRVVAMAGVQTAKVTRRWPATLVVRVTEWTPVALTPEQGRLVMLDRLGRRLPFDPTRSPADLPVAPADPVVARALHRIMEESPPLYGRISAARRLGDDVLLEMDARRLVVRAAVSAADLLNLRVTMADLVRKEVDFVELDARYANRVFVRGWKELKL
jgi:cell division septal protein FtsQ